MSTRSPAELFVNPAADFRFIGWRCKIFSQIGLGGAGKSIAQYYETIGFFLSVLVFVGFLIFYWVLSMVIRSFSDATEARNGLLKVIRVSPKTVKRPKVSRAPSDNEELKCLHKRDLARQPED